MSNQPPPPFGDQPQQGGWPPQGGGPPPPQGQPPGGYGQPPGGYGEPPGGYGQPPGGYGAPPPGFGGSGGYGPPEKSKAPLIVGIVGAVVVVALAVGGFLLLRGGDDDVVVATPTTEATPTAEATETTAPTEEVDPTPDADAPTPAPRPTATMPAPPPEPTIDPQDQPTRPPDAPSGSMMGMGDGVQGEITAAQPTVDFFLDGIAGEEIVLTMTALEASLDPILRLYAPDGSLLAENDDDIELPTPSDSRIRLQVPADGEYRVEAASFGGTTGRFAITLDFPSVLSDTDVLSEAVPEISYEYEGTAGQQIVINMRALDDAVDPLVRVLDADGDLIDQDDDGGGFPNARLELTLPADGTYTIVAGVFGSRYGEFEITLAVL